MRVYIAGPMSHHENFNYPSFHAVASVLEPLGVQVVTSKAELKYLMTTTGAKKAEVEQ